jgi:DNA modification methylase
MVAVFREVWRVLRDDGTLWLNLGDSYGADNNRNGIGSDDPKWGGDDTKRTAKHHKNLGRTERSTGLKPKDLIGVPWRVAFALQADGWYLRSDIIWSKKAPMPESVTDRPTRSHEYIFLLSKQPRYFFDSDAVRESPSKGSHGGGHANWTGNSGHTNGIGSHTFHQPNPAGRNLRSVWHLGPEPFPGAHFATFVTEIPRRAVKAGTSERGVCPQCGAPWKRVVDGGFTDRSASKSLYPDGSTASRLAQLRQAARQSGGEYTNNKHTTGWRPTCTCDAGDPVPATVLDPFNGAATTGLVCQQLGRHYVGLDLSPEYLRLSRDRLGHTAWDAWTNGKLAAAADLGPLFAAAQEPQP